MTEHLCWFCEEPTTKSKKVSLPYPPYKGFLPLCEEHLGRVEAGKLFGGVKQ